MKINLTAVKANFSSSPSIKEPSPQKMKPLDPNIISVYSNSIHYKIVREDPSRHKNLINLPISPSKNINLHVNMPLSKVNFRLEQHHPSLNPYALSAGENAQIEESDAKVRDDKKRSKVEDFLTQTRMNVIKKREDDQRERDQTNRETAQKIKKLLHETIEFSQKTVNIAAQHRKSHMKNDNSVDENHQASGIGGGTIRDLVSGGGRGTNDKLKFDPRTSASEYMGFRSWSGNNLKGSQSPPLFQNSQPMHVVEHSEHNQSESSSQHFDFGSPEINQALNQILKARKMLSKHNQQNNGHQQILHAEDSLMMQNYVEGDLDLNYDQGNNRNLNRDSTNQNNITPHGLEKDLDILKGIITDYALQQSDLKPRDFRADLPILSALKAERYDSFNVNELTIQLESALKKFTKDWKTLDNNKINYLMKFGIVQEVMKVEERKSARREAALIRAEQQEKQRNNPKSPKREQNLNNSDLQNLQSSANKSLYQTSPSQTKSNFQPVGLGKQQQQSQVPRQQLADTDKRGSTMTEASKALQQTGNSTAGFGGKSGQGRGSSVGFKNEGPAKQKVIVNGTLRTVDKSQRDGSVDLSLGGGTRSQASYSQQRPLSSTGFMKKDAPTIGNPLMMKMEYQSKQQRMKSALRSYSGIDTSSKMSRGYKTLSGKSKLEEDFEAMSIEEIDVLIEKAQREVDQAIDIRKRILRHKMLTKKLKQKKLGPVEGVINELREKIGKLEIIKDKKIPFYEKLPKDSPFYKHYMSVLYAARMQEAAQQKVQEDRVLFSNVAATIPNYKSSQSQSISKYNTQQQIV
eukprot:403352494